jgi:uncharacterized protein YkwD
MTWTLENFKPGKNRNLPLDFRGRKMIRKFSKGYLILILLAFSVSAKDNVLYGSAGIDAVGSININAGMNDAWYSPATDGQGFFITVFPDQGFVSLAWFTYDTVLPPVDASANLGDPGHRWLTAGGPIVDQQVAMNIEMTSGGVFDAASEIRRTDPPGSDGTIMLSFDSCNSGTISYDIPSIERQGVVEIQRVADDNVVLCEALKTRATDCSQGPLDAPIPNCAPEVLASTGDPAQDCVDRVNQLRWQCQCLPPLERWTEGEACANQHAEYDSVNGTHAGWRDDICLPKKPAQNECPGYNSNGHVISTCLQQMWDEGPGDFPDHGHYNNMTNPAYSLVACGVYETDSNKVWSVQNFQ